MVGGRDRWRGSFKTFATVLEGLGTGPDRGEHASPRARLVPADHVARSCVCRASDLASLRSKLVSSNLPTVVAYQVDPWVALGDPTRRAVFERVVQRPRPVGAIARDLPVSRPAVSQHLRVLKDAGLVMDRRDGNRNIYMVRREGLAALRAELDTFWNETLGNLKALVDQENEDSE